MRLSHSTLYVSVIIIAILLISIQNYDNSHQKAMTESKIAVAGVDSLPESLPEISLSIYPKKVRPGDVLLVSANISTPCQISSVKADISFENGVDIVDLSFISEKNIWERGWIVHNTKDQTAYPIIVHVQTACGSGMIQSAYFDPTVSHPAEDIEPGTFKHGDFTFEENLHIEKSALIYEDLHVADGTLEVFNTTKVVKAKNLDIESNLETEQINADNVSTSTISVSNSADVSEINVITADINSLLTADSIDIENNAKFSGKSDFLGDVTLNQDAEIKGSLTVSNKAVLKKDLEILGKTSFSQIVDFNKSSILNFIVPKSTKLENNQCDSELKGYIYFNTEDNTFMGCDGEQFRHLSYQPISIEFAEENARKWSDGSVALSCDGYKRPEDNRYAYEGDTGDGLYWIDPDGATGTNAFKVYCDMDTDSGGWTLVWSNLRGGSSKPMTSMTWTTAVNTVPTFSGTLVSNLEGFIVFTGLKYWEFLGSTLRYDWANDFGSPLDQQAYMDFYLDENNFYSIHLSNYQQPIGSSTAGLWSHNGHRFSTYDADHDTYDSNCASLYSNTPWWYGACWSGNMNGGGENSASGYYNGAYWYGADVKWGSNDGIGAGNGWYFIGNS